MLRKKLRVHGKYIANLFIEIQNSFSLKLDIVLQLNQKF